MIYEDRFNPKEIEALKSIQKMLKISDEILDYIIAYIGYESNFNSQAKHKISKTCISTGFIYYLSKSIRKSSTPKEISLMPPEEQILFIGTYLKPHMNKLNTLRNIVGVLIDPKFLDVSLSHNVYNSKLQFNCLVLGGVLPLENIYSKVKSIYLRGKYGRE